MNKNFMCTIKHTILVFFIILITNNYIVMADTIILDTKAPDTNSEGAIILDPETGQIIYGKNEHKKFMPASTTKVMTALLAVENLKLSDSAVVSKNPPLVDGSSMGFLEGEEILVEDLLYSLLIHSANDSAEILAEKISGSKEEFSLLMNKRAKELGALNTNFVNPSGISEDNHYTTPYDLSLMIRELSKHKEISNICHTYSYMLPLTNMTKDENRWVANRNALLIENNKYFYEPIIIAKTGWTPEANSSHTALAEKNGKKYIVTVMNAEKRDDIWIDTTNLFNWAFDEVEIYKAYEKNQKIKTLTLKDGSKANLISNDDFFIVSNNKNKPQTVLKFKEEDFLKSEYIKGDIFTSAKVISNESEIGNLDLIADKNIVLTNKVSKKNQESNLNKTKKMIFYPIIILIIFLLIIRIINRIRFKRKLKKIKKRK